LIYKFENYSLDAGRRELRCGSEHVAVEPQVFDVLYYLLRNRERVVSKDDLIADVWHGRIVSESTLSSRVAAARQAVGDRGEEQRLVRTIARKGFRFVGEVWEEKQPSTESAPARAPKSDQAQRQSPLSQPALQLPDKPSIVVLPFDNISGDPEQEYFVDGITEDLVTALSQFRWFFVIARGSSFAYKKRAVDIKLIGRELGVRYVLEGSVRKAAKRLRITGQLTDTSTGVNLWADRIDGELDDIFDLQDRVTASVAGAIAPKLEQAEIERARQKPTDSLDAYDYYLRGMAGLHLWTKDANAEALQMFYKAIELDPNFAASYGMAARCYSQRKFSGWTADSTQFTREAEQLARRAAELGRDNPVALCTAGLGLAGVAGKLDEGADLIDRALQLNPNLAWAWQFNGWVKVLCGEPDAAIDALQRAMRLSPQDPHIFNMRAVTASAHFFAGRYSEAATWADKAIRDRPSYPFANLIYPASKALMGQLEDARQGVARLRELDPELRISSLRHLYPLRRTQDFVIWEDGLRRAGLPD
jgi:TolB-like protein/Tfp pilus assembly protein PilF